MNFASIPPPINLLFEFNTNALPIKILECLDKSPIEFRLIISIEIPYPILLTVKPFKKTIISFFINKAVSLISSQPEQSKSFFKFIDIDAFLENQGVDTKQNNDNKSQKALGLQEINNPQCLKLNAIAFLQALKLNFLSLLNKPRGENEILKAFQNSFTLIQLHGFNLNSSPTSSQVIPLLNISEVFSRKGRFEEAMETNILLGLALINARRFLQAAEVLRKASAYFYSKTGVLMKGLKAAKIQLLVAEAIKQPSMINEKMQAYYKATELFMGKTSGHSSIVISNNYDIYTALLKISGNLCKFLLKMLFERLDPLKIAAIRGLEFLLEYMGCSVVTLLSNILKTLIITYPLQEKSMIINEAFHEKLPLQSPINTQNFKTMSPMDTGPENLQSQKLLIDIYNHLLESFLNVLTSASSFLLRSLFIEIIAPNIFLNEMNNDLRIFIFRIAEKILSICQGDLEINLTFIASLLHFLESKTPQPLRLAGSKLWETLKFKAIVNLNPLEAKRLSDWIYEGLVSSQENKEINAGVKYLLELINVLTMREKKQQEVSIFSNRLQSSVFDSNINRSMLIFESFSSILSLWLEDLMTSQQSFELIKSFWSCLLDVINCMESPEPRIKDMIFSILAKILLIIRERSPSLTILNTVLLILRTIDTYTNNINLNEFLKEFLMIFCDCIPHSIYDESFEILEILLKKTLEFFDKQLLHKTINTLIDQFTVKSKAQKQAKSSLINLIKSHKERDNLITAWIFCLFDNQEPFIETNSNIFLEESSSNMGFSLKSSGLLNSRKMHTGLLENRPFEGNKNLLDSKLFNLMHELFIEKLNFAEKLFEDLLDDQVDLLLKYLSPPNPLQTSINRLLLSGNSKIRLKGLKILRIIFERLVKKHSFKKSPFFFDYECFLISKFVLLSLKTAWEASIDPKLHFNGLLILDQLFQSILGNPDLKFELSRKDNNRELSSLLKPQYTVIDIFNYEYPIDLKLSFEDDRYLHLRLFQILRLLPSLQSLSNSPWSNIRSLAYGIICYWVKSDVSFYKPSLMKSLISPIFSLLLSLLSSKESECRTGGLNILGSFCGLGFDFSHIDLTQIKYFFRRHELLISSAIWESVFELQKDWDSTNQAAAATLVQLSVPKEMVINLYKLRKEVFLLESANNTNNVNNVNNNNNMGLYTKEVSYNKTVDSSGMGDNVLDIEEDKGVNEKIFWIEGLRNEELQELVSMFRNEYKPPQNLWIERGNYNIEDIEEDYDKFIYEADEVGNFFFEEPNVTSSNNNNNKGYNNNNINDIDNDGNLDDLGIIEINDDEWNEYYSEELKTLKNHKSNSKNIGNKTKPPSVERLISPNNNIKISENENISSFDRNYEENAFMKRGIKTEEKKIDEKAALRPHNPLFRPLTPPIRTESSYSNKASNEPFIAEIEDISPDKANNINDLELNFNNKKPRPNSGKAINSNDFFKRRDSAELYEMKIKEKFTNSSSGEDSKLDSPLLPINTENKGKNMIEGEEKGIKHENMHEKQEKVKKNAAVNRNNRKSLEFRHEIDGGDLDQKSNSTSTKLLHKLLETLQLNPKLKASTLKSKENFLQKMLKKPGSPGKLMIDNLLDSLKKGTHFTKDTKNTSKTLKSQEKARSSSLGKKQKAKLLSQKKKIQGSSKEKTTKKTKISGLKRRTMPHNEEIIENETL